MNEQDRCAVVSADVVFTVARDAAASAVQVTGAAVVGVASGLAKGLWWLTGRAAGAVVESRTGKKLIGKAAQAWGAASSAVEERKRELREAGRDG